MAVISAQLLIQPSISHTQLMLIVSIPEMHVYTQLIWAQNTIRKLENVDADLLLTLLCIAHIQETSRSWDELALSALASVLIKRRLLSLMAEQINS